MHNIVVVPLGKVSDDAIASAVAILNGSQSCFDFQVAANRLVLPEPDITVNPTGDGQLLRGYSWNALFDLLERTSAGLDTSVVVGVLDKPIEKHLFIKGNSTKDAAIVSSSGWPLMTALPVSVFVASSLVDVAAWMLASDQWHHHDDTRGCIGDYCRVKADVLQGVCSGNICPDCDKTLRDDLGQEAYDAVRSMLRAVANVAANA